MRKQKTQKKAEGVKPATEDTRDVVHQPTNRAAPAWFYDRRQFEKAEKIADWQERKLGYSLDRICQMLGVKPAFVAEVCEWFGVPMPADTAVPVKPVQPNTKQTVWVTKPKVVDGPKPVSKGGPQWVGKPRV
jgi:hypothetical protein